MIRVTWWRQRVSFCRRRALPDRDEAQTQVARLGDEAVQRGLITNGSSKEGVTGGIVPDRQAVEPFRPVVVESALDLIDATCSMYTDHSGTTVLPDSYLSSVGGMVVGVPAW